MFRSPRDFVSFSLYFPAYIRFLLELPPFLSTCLKLSALKLCSNFRTLRSDRFPPHFTELSRSIEQILHWVCIPCAENALTSPILMKVKVKWIDESFIHNVFWPVCDQKPQEKTGSSRICALCTDLFHSRCWEPMNQNFNKMKQQR